MIDGGKKEVAFKPTGYVKDLKNHISMIPFLVRNTPEGMSKFRLLWNLTGGAVIEAIRYRRYTNRVLKEMAQRREARKKAGLDAGVADPAP